MNLLPLNLRVQTFQEARNVRVALLDAPTGANWSAVRGEVAVVHKLEGQPLQVKFRPDLSLTFWREKSLRSADDLLALLRNLHPDAGLLFNMVVGAARELEHVRARPVDFVHALRWGSRSAEESSAQVSKVFGLLMLFDALRVHGERRGRWKDERTKDAISTKLDGQSLVHVAPSLDDPDSLIITAGAWLAENRGNGRLLADFGLIESLTAIPAKQRSGQTARLLGLALLQLWRECAEGAKSDRSGFTIGKTLTRMELLARAHLLEDFVSLLKGPHPARAVGLWHETVSHLRARGIVAAQISVAKPLRRQGWRDFWLYEEVSLRPSEPLQKAALEIAERSKASRRKHFAQKGGRKRAA